MTIDDIVDAVRNNRLRITDHADEEAQADKLTFDEIFFSVFQGEINEDTRWAVLITVYRPDPHRWIDWRTRRPKDDTIS
jgi:hypothetical protein